MFLIRIVLFFVIISIILRIFGRIIFFSLSKKWKTSQESDDRKEGEVTVQSDNLNKKKFNKDIGEYVNYEEVDN